MARVLYTSARGWFGEDAGFVDAATLSEALATVRALGHRRIRFWSSPALADPLDASPQAALAAAARPPWWKPLALGLALCLLLPVVWASYLEMLGLPIHAGVLGTTALTVALFLLAPTFGQLRTQIEHGELARARALLALLVLAAPPFAWLYLPWWAKVRALALRDEPDAAARAMAPFRWIARLGFHSVHTLTEGMVLDVLGESRARLEATRAALLRRPGHSMTILDEALVLVIHLGDAAGAAAALAQLGPAPLPPVQAAARRLIDALILLETGDPRAALVGIEHARGMFHVAAPSVAASWEPLFDVSAARAQARAGRRDLARELFRRAHPELLWTRSCEVLDRASLDVFG